jgi:hypothetical protein
MPSRIIRNICVFLVSMGIMVSCATKTSTIIWKDEKYKSGAIDNVLIIGVTKKKENRSLFENALSEAFRKEGVTVYNSVDVFSPDQKLTKDVIKEKAVSLGVKAVILTHLFSVTEEDVYHPGGRINSRYVYANRYGYYFGHAHSVVNYPGKYEKQKLVRLKTNLYETSSENLIFTISSKTMDPKSVNDTIHSVCRAFMKDFRENDLL